MPDEQTSRRLTWLPSLAALLAFIACNGIGVMVGMLSLIGITIAINPDVQAAAISLFALLALGFVALSYRKHQNIGPLLLVGVGAILIVGTMYVAFNKIVESVGLLGLMASAIWSWRASRTHAPLTSARSHE